MADTWQVVAQTQQQTLGPSGRIETVWNVTFRTEHGVTASVQIGANDYTPDKVHAAIQAQVDAIDAIHKL